MEDVGGLKEGDEYEQNTLYEILQKLIKALIKKGVWVINFSF